MSKTTEMIVLPSLRGRLLQDGRIQVTTKLLDGLAQYAARWPGPVTAILHPDRRASSGNLDDVAVDPASLPFTLKLIPFDSLELLRALKSARLVQGGADYLLNRIPEFCRSESIPYVFVSEYTLRTRRQIIDAETQNLGLRLRRYMWAWNQERINRRNAALSAAVQCNGTPTFTAYKDLNSRVLLYFDTRVRDDMMLAAATLERRVAGLRAKQPLRLAFSGRLNRMKGADDLLSVARRLKELQVPFTFDICGDGDLTGALNDGIATSGLGDFVRLRGVLEFERELVQFMQSEIDLFVCCHRQGDPSCTYLETLACGVPIVGYDNEALVGLLEHCPAGWTVPMNRPAALADLIASLYSRPEELLSAANRGLAFARKHVAERTFANRISHMEEVAEVA